MLYQTQSIRLILKYVKLGYFCVTFAVCCFVFEMSPVHPHTSECIKVVIKLDVTKET